jgi:hypothetical protein
MLAMSVSISAEPALSASEIRHQPDRKDTPHFAPLNPSYLLPQAGHQREVRCWPFSIRRIFAARRRFRRTADTRRREVTAGYDAMTQSGRAWKPPLWGSSSLITFRAAMLCTP